MISRHILVSLRKIIPHDYKKMMDLIAYYQSQGLDEDQAKVEAFNAL